MRLRAEVAVTALALLALAVAFCVYDPATRALLHGHPDAYVDKYLRPHSASHRCECP